MLAQVTLSIHLNDSQVDQFEKRIPVELAAPPWNYTRALQKGIQVHCFVPSSCEVQTHHADLYNNGAKWNCFIIIITAFV